MYLHIVLVNQVYPDWLKLGLSFEFHRLGHRGAHKMAFTSVLHFHVQLAKPHQ